MLRKLIVLRVQFYYEKFEGMKFEGLGYDLETHSFGFILHPSFKCFSVLLLLKLKEVMYTRTHSLT